MLSASIGAAVLGLAGLLVLLAGGGLRDTTLRGAWAWAIVAVAGWFAVGLLTVSRSPAGWLDRGWYVAAVLTLTPFVHVLGARRPVVRSWNGFVLLPMLAVLGLPVVTSGDWNTPFEVELPPLLGFLLVLVMGAGNYFGTRFTLPVLVLAAGLAVAVVAGSNERLVLIPNTETARLVAVGFFGVAVILAGRRAGHPEPEGEAAEEPEPRLELLWIDFRDLFGIVWAKRVMDRVNESLRTAGLETRLDLDGIRWTDGERPEAERVIQGTFAWLLKRFVDPPFAARYGVTLRDDRDV